MNQSVKRSFIGGLSNNKFINENINQLSQICIYMVKKTTNNQSINQPIKSIKQTIKKGRIKREGYDRTRLLDENLQITH
jgi:hypothetical protein